jgi:hypothetical protein
MLTIFPPGAKGLSSRAVEALVDHHCSWFGWFGWFALFRSRFLCPLELRERAWADVHKPPSHVVSQMGIGVGGAFDGDTASGEMPVARRVAGVRAFRRS